MTDTRHMQRITPKVCWTALVRCGLFASGERLHTMARTCLVCAAAIVALWCAAGASASPATPANLATESPAAPSAPSDQTSSPLPEMTVEAQRVALQQRVEGFVRGVTRNPGISDNESLVRWNIPICLFASGFLPEDIKTVIARLSQIISAAGAPLASEPCKPNFVVIATSEPDQVLEAWYARNSQLFGDASLLQIHHFLNSISAGPIRVWHNINRGRTSTMRFGHFVPSNSRAESSPFVWNAVLNFFSIFAIVDTGRVQRVTLDQLTDYVAMAGLSNVDLDADIGSAPSILRLFSASGTPLSGLSNWDAAFLKALYQSDQTSRTQRHDIAERVIHEISR
jgi:hypothetical protein